MTESGDWVMYRFEGFADHDDPTKYENQVRQQGKYTATTWVLRVNVEPVLVPRTLETLASAAESRRIHLTHEFTYDDGQLSVYYNAMSASSALLMGQALAWLTNHETYLIAPAGDFTQVLLRQRKEGDE